MKANQVPDHLAFKAADAYKAERRCWRTMPRIAHEWLAIWEEPPNPVVLGPEVKPSPEFVRKVADERFATEAEARAYIEHQCWKAALAAVLPST